MGIRRRPAFSGVGLSRSAIAPCTIFAASLAVFCYFIDPTPALLDVGFNANSALRIARGEVPYRDFSALITPLSFLINAAIITVFGASLHAIQLGAAVIAAIAYVTLYAIARQFMTVAGSVATWLAAMIFSPAMEGVSTAYSTTADAFALLAVLLIARGCRREKRRHFLTAGVAVGLCFWTKQTLGAYVLLSLALFFACRVRHRTTPAAAATTAVGFVGVTVLFVGYLGWHGAIGSFVDDCVLTPYRYFTVEARLPSPSLRDLGWDAEGLEPLLYFVAIGAVIVSLGRLVRDRRRGPIDPALLFAALASGGLLLITRERYGVHNLLCVAPLTFVLLIQPIHATWTNRTRGRWTAVAAVGGVLLFCAFGLRYARYRWQRMDVVAYEARARFAQRVFEEHVGQRIVVLPCAPMFYFEAHASNPTRFDLVIPGNLSPADKLEFADALSSRVDVVLFDEFWQFDRVPFARYNAMLYATLQRDFEPIANGPQGQVIYARRR